MKAYLCDRKDSSVEVFTQSIRVELFLCFFGSLLNGTRFRSGEFFSSKLCSLNVIKLTPNQSFYHFEKTIYSMEYKITDH